jgi:hypothetical protein
MFNRNSRNFLKLKAWFSRKLASVFFMVARSQMALPLQGGFNFTVTLKFLPRSGRNLNQPLYDLL